MNATSAKKGLKFSQRELHSLHHKQGLNWSEIGRQYGVSPQAIKYWAVKLDVTHSRLKAIFWDEPSPALSYIVGVLLGDGFLYINKKDGHHKVYRIIMRVTDLPFAKTFQKSLRLIGLNANLIPIKTRVKGQKQVYMTYASSKKFCMFWTSLSNKKRIALGNKFPKDFIRGVYDSEGSIKWHRKRLELTIYSTNTKLQNNIMTILQQWKLTPKLFTYQLESGKLFHHVSLYRQLDVRRFLVQVIPTIKVEPRDGKKINYQKQTSR